MGRRITSEILLLLKKETVLCVAVLLALVSMVFVRPDMQYAEYLDYRVLALLFCLMAIMEGFKQTGLFNRLAAVLLKKASTTRQLYLVLVLLCFFTSMWITNDVALLTFVPFAILVLSMAGLQKEMIPVVVFQTIAANLGSMLTPVGNPQNLYLYSLSGMGMGEFLVIMAPLTIVSLFLVLAACLIRKKDKLNQELFRNMDGQNEGASVTEFRNNRIKNLILAVLFLLSLLSVARLLSWQILLGITLITCVGLKVFGGGELLLKRVDYGLLLTFVAFFVFIGNMGRIEAVRIILSEMLAGRELLLSFGCSQIISNVPAAILLSGFTGDYAALLKGVNIGGLGTLIASLASLISYKLFARAGEQDAKMGSKGKYFVYFTAWNVVFAVVLLLVA